MANTSVKYSDFNTQFAQHPVSNDLAPITDFNDVSRSVKSLILTNKYERLLNPRIGSNIRNLLFEPMDGSTAAVLQSYIRETIENYEPRALLQDVAVIPDFEHQTYNVTITFFVTFSQELITLPLFLRRIR